MNNIDRLIQYAPEVNLVKAKITKYVVELNHLEVFDPDTGEVYEDEFIGHLDSHEAAILIAECEGLIQTLENLRSMESQIVENLRELFEDNGEDWVQERLDKADADYADKLLSYDQVA